MMKPARWMALLACLLTAVLLTTPAALAEDEASVSPEKVMIPELSEKDFHWINNPWNEAVDGFDSAEEGSLFAYDLISELDHVQVTDITVEPASGLVKNEQATVSFTLSAEGSPVEHALLPLVAEHCAFLIQTGPLTVPMARVGDSWTYVGSLSLPTAGTYVLLITCTVDTDEIAPFVNESFTMEVVNRKPTRSQQTIPDVPAELVLAPDGDRESCQLVLTASTLFTDPDQDVVYLSVDITNEDGDLVGIADTDQGYVVDGYDNITNLSQLESAVLIFTQPGVYTLRVAGSDGVDAAEDGYEAIITVVPSRTILLRRILLGAAVAAAALLLLLLLRQLTKPSYAGKQLTVSVNAGLWAQETTLSLAPWKKKKRPFSWLLTAASCPADEALYRPFAEVVVKPARHGVTLTGMQALTGRKAESITPDSPLKLTAGGYEVALTVDEHAK